MLRQAAPSNASPGTPGTTEIRLAERLRQLRAEKGLTLRELAGAAGISPAFLSRIENHRVSLTIGGLERLAIALGVPVSVFFEEQAQTAPIVVCRAGQGATGRLRGPKGFLYQMLASAKRGKLMEPLLVDVASGQGQMPLLSHPGEEFNYVVRGECRFVYGKDEMHLHAGDALYYEASVPHAARPIRGKACAVLSIVASRDYVFHGDLSRLMKGNGR